VIGDDRGTYTGIGVVAVGLAGLLSAACGDGGVTRAAAVADELVVRRDVFQQRWLLTGELQAVHSDKIVVPRTPSWQMPIRWLAEDGIVVNKGDKVLELDNSQFSGELEQKRLAADSALNELMRKEADVAVQIADNRFAVEQKRIQLEKARLEAEIPEQLRSRREHQEKQLALAQAQVEHRKALEELEATQKAADAEIEEFRITLERTRDEIRTAEEAIGALILNAPRTGILVVAENRREGRKFKEGDNVWIGLAVMSIPELSEMQVDAILFDVDDGKIRPGMRAEAALDTYPDEVYPGEVLDIAPVAKEEGRQGVRRVFRVTVGLERADPEKMRPGMSVRVEIFADSRDEALVIPRAALDFSSEPARALLSDGSEAEVQLGPCDALSCVVEAGLEEGTRLRVRG
jgi:multidrug efflux pump subunit AcrA (membrane-fusion protein)